MIESLLWLGCSFGIRPTRRDVGTPGPAALFLAGENSPKRQSRQGLRRSCPAIIVAESPFAAPAAHKLPWPITGYGTPISIQKCDITKYLKFRYIYSSLVMYMRTEILRYGRIRDIRNDRGLTQEQIARFLHVSQNTYSQYEIGTTRFPLDVVVKLAEYYNVSMDYLVGLTDDPTPYSRKRRQP